MAVHCCGLDIPQVHKERTSAEQYNLLQIGLLVCLQGFSSLLIDGGEPTLQWIVPHWADGPGLYKEAS